MRLFHLSILAALLSLPLSPVAWAAEPSESKTTLDPACGSSAKEAIAAAEKAVTASVPEKHKHAIMCLIAAVKALEGAHLDALHDKDKTRMLRVPRNP
jgi:hypothetical protein